MGDETPIQSALEAERSARQAVEQARERAAVIRQEARERARYLEQRAQARVRRLHNAVEEKLGNHRKLIEGQGAEALRELRREAIDPDVMKKTIEELVDHLMAERKTV